MLPEIAHQLSAIWLLIKINTIQKNRQAISYQHKRVDTLMLAEADVSSMSIVILSAAAPGNIDKHPSFTDIPRGSVGLVVRVLSDQA